MQNGNRVRTVLQGRVDSLIEELENLKNREFVVFRVDNVPGRGRAVRVEQVALVDVEALVVVFIFPKIRIMDAPPGILAFAEGVEALFLLLLGNVEEELVSAKKALSILGGSVKEVKSFSIGQENMARTLICIEKVKKTPGKYPRKAGTPSRQPLG